VQKSLIATTRLRRLKNNAENVFGIIDPNQYWRTVTSGTVTITANADLDDIAKVQILTESPFFNDQAKILAEADVTAGQTVQLSYDAPRENSTLVAACVDSKGHHYIKPFDAGSVVCMAWPRNVVEKPVVRGAGVAVTEYYREGSACGMAVVYSAEELRLIRFYAGCCAFGAALAAGYIFHEIFL
jgi:hypothetical protein